MSIEDGEIKPLILRNRRNFKKKEFTYVICGYYGYDIPCPYESKKGTCNRIHCPIVKSAFNYSENQTRKGEKTYPNVIREILS